MSKRDSAFGRTTEVVALGRKLIADRGGLSLCDQALTIAPLKYQRHIQMGRETMKMHVQATSSSLPPRPHAPAPGPYDWMSVTARHGSSDGHIYLIDANGRKIGAVWGRTGEKIATAKLLARAWELMDSDAIAALSR